MFLLKLVPKRNKSLFQSGTNQKKNVICDHSVLIKMLDTGRLVEKELRLGDWVGETCQGLENLAESVKEIWGQGDWVTERLRD